MGWVPRMVRRGTKRGLTKPAAAKALPPGGCPVQKLGFFLAIRRLDLRHA